MQACMPLTWSESVGPSVRGSVAVRAVFGEPGDRAVDEAGVVRAQRFVVEAQALHHAGAEILEHHVGLPCHPAEGLLPGRRGDVEGEAQLVAVECAEVVAVTRRVRAQPELAECVPALRALDLDDPGAEIGELQPRVRARDELPQLENADAFQRTRHGVLALHVILRAQPEESAFRFPANSGSFATLRMTITA